jgi:hypothetical protein
LNYDRRLKGTSSLLNAVIGTYSLLEK